MALRTCLDCGALSNKARCPKHRRVVEARRTRRKRATRPYTRAEQARRADIVNAWRTTYGDWCPGWQRPPHASTDLTADHIESFAKTRREAGPLQVLCRPCNSAKQAN